MQPLDSPAWYIGTIGFSYADWKGVFYPQGLPPRNYLNYYSRVFNSVEIDSSFYGVPRKDVILRWSESTPMEFRFCVKAPYTITHAGDALAALRTLEDFFETIAHFKEKLGALLFQFPPGFQVEGIESLERFLKYLPREFRVALEFRHISWYLREANEEEPRLATLLREFGVCWVASEHPAVPAVLYPTSDFLYLRWIGKHGTFQRHHQVRINRRATMEQWNKMVMMNPSTVRDVFGFFSNDFAGCAAMSAMEMLEVIGQPSKRVNPSLQRRLF